MLKRVLVGLYREGPRRTAQRIASYTEDLVFDRITGLDTAGFIPLSDLGLDADAVSHSNPYQPTRVRHTRQLLDALPLPDKPVLVDLGCGKGRLLCIAAEGHFERVVGVELSDQLALVAQRNGDRHRASGRATVPIDVVQADVLDFPIEADHNVFYCFRSFDRTLTEQVVDRIAASHAAAPRRLLLVFSYYDYGDLLDDHPLFTLHDTLIYGGGEFRIYEAGGVSAREPGLARTTMPGKVSHDCRVEPAFE